VAVAQNKVILDNGKVLNESYYHHAWKNLKKNKKFGWG
jgi:hypothetical protein